MIASSDLGNCQLKNDSYLVKEQKNCAKIVEYRIHYRRQQTAYRNVQSKNQGQN